MKFYFKTLLPYIFMLFGNYFLFRAAFFAMTYPNDLTFMGGILIIAFVVVADVVFILRQVKKLVVVEQIPPDADPTPKS